MNEDEIGAIIHRMMRDLDEDARESHRKPRCEGCGARVARWPRARSRHNERPALNERTRRSTLAGNANQR